MCIRDRTYNAVGDNRKEKILGEDGKALYQYDEWQIAYQPLRRFEDGMSDRLIALDSRRRDLDEEAVVSVATGFMFDSTPVADADVYKRQECTGMASSILKKVVSHVKTERGLVIATILTAWGILLGTGQQYVAIIMAVSYTHLKSKASRYCANRFRAPR